MSDSESTADARIDQQPDPDFVIPDAHLASEEFVQVVILTLESSAFIEVGKLTKVGGGFDLLIDEVEPDKQD